MTRTTLTPTDLAERWNSSTGTLANMRSRREGPRYLKLMGDGGKVLYRLEDIEEYEVARLIEPVSA